MMQVIGSNLSQWDVGRRVIVTDSNATHVHFANQGDSKAVIMEIQNEEVLIPDYLLQTGKQVMAYAVFDGITLEKKVFVVQKRERPENYIYDHDDRNYIYELIDKAETAVNNANETLEGFKSAVESGEYNGITPHIGANENWFIGEEDTGKTSRGEPGYTPKKGVDYFTTDEVNAIVEEASSKASAGNIDLSKYAKKEDIPKKPEDIGALPDTYTPPNQTAEQVGADPKGTADTTVSWHNASADSHNDIRLAVKAINDRLTAFFDSDDATLDELSEIVAYITANKTLIEGITTGKVNVADIANNLTTNAANKPLSAAQGVVLKGLIDAVSTSLSDYALKSEIPSVPVRSVNGKTGAVILNADDVGARPSSWMPSASDVGALPDTYVPPNQTASQVGADPVGTAASAVSAHNTKTDAHNDIRLLISAQATRLDALANSDDETLDQMAEVVAYIKDNRDLIEQVTTGKVSITDIVNNLTTNVSNKPLSAAQGVALKALIDAITIPTKLSQLTSDSTHRVVTDAEKEAWSAKSDFSGYYADLIGKPTIPTVPTNVSAFTNDAGYIKGYTETDPTVPSWAKAQTKPSYSKSEVGLGNVDNVKQYSASNPPPYPVTSVNGKTGAVALDIPVVPSKVSAFENDAKYLTSFTETDPTVPAWAKNASKPSYTASEVGAVPTARKVNGKALSSDITLSASDVSAVPNTQTITVTGVDASGTTHTWTMYGVKN